MYVYICVCNLYQIRKDEDIQNTFLLSLHIKFLVNTTQQPNTTDHLLSMYYQYAYWRVFHLKTLSLS